MIIQAVLVSIGNEGLNNYIPSVIVEVKVVWFPVSIATILHRWELCVVLTQIVVFIWTINPIIAHFFWSVRRHKEILRGLLQLSIFNKLLVSSIVLILNCLGRILLWFKLSSALLNILIDVLLLRLLVEDLLGRNRLRHRSLALLR